MAKLRNPPTPPSPDDIEAWDLLALKLALIGSKWFMDYARDTVGFYSGDTGYAVALTGKEYAGLELGDANCKPLVAACKRLRETHG